MNIKINSYIYENDRMDTDLIIKIITAAIALSAFFLSIINSIILYREKKRLTKIFLLLEPMGNLELHRGGNLNSIRLKIYTNSTINYFVSAIKCNKYLNTNDIKEFTINNSKHFEIILNDGGVFQASMERKVKLEFTLYIKNMNKPVKKIVRIKKIKI